MTRRGKMKQAWGWAALFWALCLAAGPARAAEWFVATNGNDAADGTTWATAKLTIQAAIDTAVSNDTVWVSNGVYATGGRAVYGAMTNRVVIDKPITVRSTNGPAVTVIQGAWHPGTTNGDTAARCVYVGLNATLIGFTLTNGATHKIGDVGREMAGGGAYCETSSVLTNCIVTGNSAHYFGGGVFRGVLYNCTISRNMNNQERGGGTCESTLYYCTLIGNSATAGGGAALGSLYNCTLVGNLATNGFGGGAYYATLNDCTLASNSAYYSGGVYHCTLTNCVLTANSGVGGGGAWESTLNNCTLVGNSATNGYGGGCSSYSTLNDCTLSGNSASLGGGASDSTLNRCVLTSNTAIRFGGGADGGTLNNCIIIGNKSGSGGGACDSTLNNCAIAGNSAETQGGGSLWGTLNNCTISENEAKYGGGSYGDTLNNCIVYYNRSTLIIINKAGGNHDSSTFNYCCTTPDPGGIGNITSEPQFVDAAAGNYRLKTNSPCIDRGSNALAQGTADLDGNPRILNGVVDMGAYETQLYTGFRAWAAAITNGLTNALDCAAGDGVPNLLKYAAGGRPMETDGLARLDLAFENGVPALCFNRNTNATDVTLVIQGADEMSDGAAWRGLATNVNGSWGGAANVSESGPGNPVACAAQDPVPLFTNRFLRLKVTRP